MYSLQFAGMHLFDLSEIRRARSLLGLAPWKYWNRESVSVACVSSSSSSIWQSCDGFGCAAVVVYWRLAETKADIKHAVLSGLVILGTTKEGAVTNTCKLYYRSGFVHSGTIFATELGERNANMKILLKKNSLSLCGFTVPISNI